MKPGVEQGNWVLHVFESSEEIDKEKDTAKREEREKEAQFPVNIKLRELMAAERRLEAQEFQIDTEEQHRRERTGGDCHCGVPMNRSPGSQPGAKQIFVSDTGDSLTAEWLQRQTRPHPLITAGGLGAGHLISAAATQRHGELEEKHRIPTRDNRERNSRSLRRSLIRTFRAAPETIMQDSTRWSHSSSESTPGEAPMEPSPPPAVNSILFTLCALLPSLDPVLVSKKKLQETKLREDDVGRSVPDGMSFITLSGEQEEHSQNLNPQSWKVSHSFDQHTIESSCQ
ncbi:unnamed protein product [Pleuronectes platessa]|uniref:Uncharacterized protein n=1 Tax=Pleuronectes platessa TaxID=8262 RepID=A0A9N7TPZ7_PLEPL|nr:unnamed protein product [Pleuronectes platessa]